MGDAVFLLGNWGMVIAWLMFQARLRVPLLQRIVGVGIVLALVGCVTWKIIA